jgi:transcription termination factor NusB
MQNLIKTKTRLAFIQFIFSNFFSEDEILEDTESFQNYFYKLLIPSTDKDQETIFDFNKNFFTKLSLSYFEFIKRNNVDDLIDPFINFDRKYKNWSLINKSIILAIFSEIEISKKEKIKILINDYFNISKSLITKKELGMINAITDKYINENKII